LTAILSHGFLLKRFWLVIRSLPLAIPAKNWAAASAISV
jgi:hypothetical protein